MLLVAASALLAPLPYADLRLWPVATIAWVPLMLAVRRLTPRPALVWGACCGAMTCAIGFRWLPEAFGGFSGASPWFSWGAFAALSVYQGSRMALTALLYALLPKRPAMQAWLFPVAFATAELALPMPMAWYYGAALIEAPWMTQVADLGGPLAVSALAASCNAFALAALDMARLRTRALLGAMTIGLWPLLSLGYGAWATNHWQHVLAGAPTAEVGIVQANLGVLEKRNSPRQSIDRHVRLTQELLSRERPELVIWSETAVPNAVPEAIAGEWYREHVLSDIDAPLLFGAALVKQPPPQLRLSNSAVLVDSKGRMRGRYEKRQLMLGAEHVPFGESPWARGAVPDALHFVAGTDPKPLALGPHGLAVSICLEDLSPKAARETVNAAEVDLLVNLTNDAWFGRSYASEIHFALARFRAIEQRRYLVRVTNTGVSAVVDPLGRAVVRLPRDRPLATTAEVRWLRSRTVYGATGDAPFWLVALALPLAIIVGRRKVA